MSSDLENYPPFRFAAILICVICVVYISSVLQAVFVTLIFSVIFAVMLYPLARRFESWKFPRGIAAIVAIVLASTFTGTIIYFLGDQMIQLGTQRKELLDKVEVMMDDTQSYISAHFGIKKYQQTQQIEHQVENVIENGGKIAATVIKAIANFLRDVTLIPLFVFFFLYFRDFLLEFFHRAFSAENKIIDGILAKMYDVIQRWFTGVVVVMVIVGVLNTLGLLALGIPYAAFFGFLASALLVIPYVGIIFGSLLPVVMALITKDSYWYAFGVVAIFWIIQVLEANIITPYIVGSKISINPMVAILVLILFGNLWGISGLILALPITALLKIIFDEIPETQPLGFVLGEPADYHLRNRSAIEVKLDETKSQLERSPNKFKKHSRQERRQAVKQ